MPKKKPTSNVVLEAFKGIWNGIKMIITGIWKLLILIFIWLKYILIFIERSAKTIMIFIVSIAFLILALSTSFYLVNSSFGTKDSPAFQDLRDKVARMYVLSIEDDLRELEDKTIENNQ